jgi:peptidoglycan/LPS O-acetylase OafA/YrhL
MPINESSKARKQMRLAYAISILAIAFGAFALWSSDGKISHFFTLTLISAGLLIIVLAWAASVFLRNRQRRRSMEMRDSALW